MDHITITGDLGSGKSAISKLISQERGYKQFSTGSAQRAIAEKLGITTLELNQRAETDPSIDEEIDSIFKSLKDNPEPYIVDSRMAWHFLPDSFKVKLVVDIETAARRVMGDATRTKEKYATVEDAISALKARRDSEILRFKKYYNVDLNNLKNYDLVVDTTSATPEEIKNQILEAADKFHSK
jgi:cytidylate kinase